ncbi:MAG: hypothetical protein M1840_004029 [Geoglossum simile]|nr:MAG: hypothetical protein M1840_004029 [Geoglossum simile]
MWGTGQVDIGSGYVAGEDSVQEVHKAAPLPAKAAFPTPPAVLSPRQQCNPLLIDDWASQSRLTFLFYNALLQPSSDDGTMSSVAVSHNRVTYTPKNKDSYWFTQFGCVSATASGYGGIGCLMKAPAGTKFSVEIQTNANCDVNTPTSNVMTSQQLGWVFDGTEKFYEIPFRKFGGLDTAHLTSIVFSQLSKAVTYGPIAFYCGTTGSAFPDPTTSKVIEPSSTVPATIGPSSFVIDKFANKDTNALGFYHGGDDEKSYKISGGSITFTMNGNADLAWYTQVANGCIDFTSNNNGYLHIAYKGSAGFSIALQQHNPTCDETINPYPYTWDDVEASRYSNTGGTDIYVPLSHFQIDKTKTIGFALHGFYTKDQTTVSLIEIIKTVPGNFPVPSKLDTAPLIFSCTRPNSFAFAIDDGVPELAQRVMEIIKEAGIEVTFFTVGAGLKDSSTGFKGYYSDMLGRGSQMALHSYTHPPMEGLGDLEGIDWEIVEDVNALKDTLGVESKYFRPPFGTIGARTRQRLAAKIPDSRVIMWSIDVQDWLWAESPTPEKQLDAFKADLAKGGNLVVMHYLYQSTVDLLPQFIALAKATGKNLMRVDQCLEDGEAPPL